MPNPTAAMLTIGDEILSGRTRDANLPHLAEALAARGIALREARVVPDVADEIVAAVNALRARYDHVFTSGGIGPTHDDITADAIAAAFGVPIGVREDARAILATNYANPEVELNEARLRMARIPDGATLIDNPVSKAPGFSLGNVHVMAGVPAVFQAMVAGLLPGLTGGRPLLSETRPHRPARGGDRRTAPADRRGAPRGRDRQLPVQQRRAVRGEHRRPQRGRRGARRRGGGAARPRGRARSGGPATIPLIPLKSAIDAPRRPR